MEVGSEVLREGAWCTWQVGSRQEVFRVLEVREVNGDEKHSQSKINSNSTASSVDIENVVTGEKRSLRIHNADVEQRFSIVKPEAFDPG